MKASDVMTASVFCVNVNASILDAAKMMLREHISGLPVINDANELVGMITEGDMLRRVETGTERERPHWLEFLVGTRKLASDYVSSHSRKVADLMSRDVVVVSENTTLQDVVGIMERKKIKRVPVALRGRVVGIITRANLLKALVGKPTPRGDEAIRRDVEAGW